MCRQVRDLLGGCTLFGLVNNAGVGYHGPLMYQPISEFAGIIETNLTGTLIVTQVRPACLLEKCSAFTVEPL